MIIGLFACLFLNKSMTFTLMTDFEAKFLELLKIGEIVMSYISNSMVAYYGHFAQVANLNFIRVYITED